MTNHEISNVGVRPDDGPAHVVACAGAPACRSALAAQRASGSGIAQAADPFLDGSFTIQCRAASRDAHIPAPPL